MVEVPKDKCIGMMHGGRGELKVVLGRDQWINVTPGQKVTYLTNAKRMVYANTMPQHFDPKTGRNFSPDELAGGSCAPPRDSRPEDFDPKRIKIVEPGDNLPDFYEGHFFLIRNGGTFRAPLDLPEGPAGTDFSIARPDVLRDKDGTKRPFSATLRIKYDKSLKMGDKVYRLRSFEQLDWTFPLIPGAEAKLTIDNGDTAMLTFPSNHRPEPVIIEYDEKLVQYYNQEDVFSRPRQTRPWEWKPLSVENGTVIYIKSSTKVINTHWRPVTISITNRRGAWTVVDTCSDVKFIGPPRGGKLRQLKSRLLENQYFDQLKGKLGILGAQNSEATNREYRSLFTIVEDDLTLETDLLDRPPPYTMGDSIAWLSDIAEQRQMYYEKYRDQYNNPEPEFDPDWKGPKESGPPEQMRREREEQAQQRELDVDFEKTWQWGCYDVDDVRKYGGTPHLNRYCGSHPLDERCTNYYEHVRWCPKEKETAKLGWDIKFEETFPNGCYSVSEGIGPTYGNLTERCDQTPDEAHEDAFRGCDVSPSNHAAIWYLSVLFPPEFLLPQSRAYRLIVVSPQDPPLVCQLLSTRK